MRERDVGNANGQMLPPFPHCSMHLGRQVDPKVFSIHVPRCTMRKHLGKVDDHQHVSDKTGAEANED